MTVRLRPYQSQMIDDTRAAMVAGHRSILLVAPTGSGKMGTLTKMAVDAAAKGRRTYLVFHVRELCWQASDWLQRWGARYGIIMAGENNPDAAALIQVCMIQTISRRTQNMALPDMVVVDECLPGMSIVGGKPIQDIRAGDMVDSYNHNSGQIEKKRVVWTKKTSRDKLYKIQTATKTIYCTDNHPIFIDGLYIAAKDVSVGMMLTTMENENVQMHGMSDGIYRGVKKPKGRPKSTRPNLLLRWVQKDLGGAQLIRAYGADEQEICVSQNAGEQSHETCGRAGQGFYDIARGRPQAGIAGGQWAATADGTGGTCYGAWLADRIYIRNWGKTPISIPLQIGHSQSATKNIHRGGRRLPSLACRKRKGSPERRLSGVERVENIEILEKRYSREFGEVCPDGFVYDIEVEDNHNFFADGVLVHNSHHARASSYTTLRTVWPQAYFLGFTATPVRLSGEALLGEGQFSEMIVGPSVGQLTEQGFLAPVKLYTQPESIDLSQIKMTGGDYNEEALDRIFSDDLVGKHVGNAVDEYRKYCVNAPALVVGVSVRHAMRLAGLFTDAGYKAIAVHGGMPREERLKAVLDFETGAVKILTYCQVFGEGVDLPAATALFFMRPTASLVVWKQNCGRVMRPAPGKTQAYVFDHVGNAKRQFFGVPMGHPAEEICWKEVIFRQQQMRARKSRKGVVPVVFKRCPKCLDIHAHRLSLCPKCGHDYAAEAAREAEQEIIEAELQEYKKAQMVAARKGARTLEELIEHGKKMNYKPGWARMVWEARQRKAR